MSDELEPVRRYWEQRAVHCATDGERIESGERAQRMRFSVFTGAHDLAGCSLLDIGCGVGDFVAYLDRRGIACDYCGVDLAAAMIARAKDRFPHARFELRDIVENPPDRAFDYTVAFAVHNIRVPQARGILERALTRQFELASRAAHISLLCDRYQGFAPHIQAWRAEEILEFALSLTPYVMLRHDYLPHDFSLTLYRQPMIDTHPDLAAD